MPQEIQRWDKFLRRLKHPCRKKILTLLEMNLIEGDGIAGKWKILPIPGYNITTYEVNYSRFSGWWDCNCQGFATKGKCAHILAVKLWLKQRGETLTAPREPINGSLPMANYQTRLFDSY